jgi:peptidoglycan lytic transglycosylase
MTSRVAAMAARSRKVWETSGFMGLYGDSGTTHRLARVSVTVIGCFILTNCSSTQKLTDRVDPKYGVTASPRVVEPGQPVPKGGGVYRVGKPYTVAGREYVPEENRYYRAEGLASWYGDDFHGRLTANGEIYDMNAISAAHPTMPMPSYARVTNLATGKSLIVRVNDRGPYHANREIDVSSKAAELLGFKGHGVARVRVEYVGAAPIEGTDDRLLLATLRQGTPAPPPPSVMVASNRFLPNFGRPPSAMPGGVPMPQERPYDLGQNDGRYAAYQPPTQIADADSSTLARAALARHGGDPRLADVSPDTDMPAYMARAPKPRMTRIEDLADNEPRPPLRGATMPQGWTAQPPATSPVTAYAPASDVSRAISTGRGLY